MGFRINRADDADGGDAKSFTHELAFFLGIDTKALPIWDSRTRWNNLNSDLTRMVGPSRCAISPHPSSHEGYHSTARSRSGFHIGYDLLYLSIGNGFPGRAELVNPNAAG